MEYGSSENSTTSQNDSFPATENIVSPGTIDAEVIKVESLTISDADDVGLGNHEDVSDNATAGQNSISSTTNKRFSTSETVDMDGKIHETQANNIESGATGKNEHPCSPGGSFKRSNSRNRCYRNRHSPEDETSSDNSNANSQDTPRPLSRSSEGKRTAKLTTDEDLPPQAKYPRHQGDESESKSNQSVSNNFGPHLDNTTDPDSVETELLIQSILSDSMSSEGNSPEPSSLPTDASQGEQEDGEVGGLLLEPDTSSSDSSDIVFEDNSSNSSSDLSLEDLEGQEPNTNISSISGNQVKTEVIKKKSIELPKVLCKPKAKETWNGPKALLQREMGLSYRSGRQIPQSAEFFRAGFYGSLFSAERLELMAKLDGHEGCVNCLNFNFSGTKLASGSDDLSIKIWNYSLGKCITSFSSGHRANVFQAKFMPFIGMDTMIVSCARDNQVRLNELSSSGEVRSSRKLAQHKGPAHKLSISPDNPHVVLSCGEDSYVFSIDTREEKPCRLLNVREGGKKVALYSIHQNPFIPQEFCVSGKDSYVRVYDVRKLPNASVSVDPTTSQIDDDSVGSRRISPVKKFCPHHLVNAESIAPYPKTNVTAAVYNYNGKEILASYNDEHIYLFDSSHSDTADYIKKFEGHRNNATIKGVNFFGDRSQFVVSGSDCGHVFLWDKTTESIVNFFRGDESGVVNCLEGHPTVPILATSGLDDDIKIWVPSHEQPPRMPELTSTVKRNYKKRENEARDNPESDGFLMWALLNQMRAGRRNRRGRRGNEDSEDSWEDFDSDDDDDEAGPHGMDCVIT